MLGLVASVWPLWVLHWCRSEDFLFLHRGQKQLIRLAYAMLLVFAVLAMLFAVALASPTRPIYELQ